jgi:hypothetical protein
VSDVSNEAKHQLVWRKRDWDPQHCCASSGRWRKPRRGDRACRAILAAYQRRGRMSDDLRGVSGTTVRQIQLDTGPRHRHLHGRQARVAIGKIRPSISGRRQANGSFATLANASEPSRHAHPKRRGQRLPKRRCSTQLHAPAQQCPRASRAPRRRPPVITA